MESAKKFEFKKFKFHPFYSDDSFHRKVHTFASPNMKVIILTLSAMAPWDLIDSWGRGVQSARTFKNIKNLSKSSFDHEILHLPQDAFRTRL